MLKLGKKSSVDLLSGDEGWVIFKFSVPIILSYLLQQIYTISDAAICGQTLGVDDIAGVNDVFPILFIFLQFAVGCTAGFSVITSIAAGRGDQARVRRSFAAQLVLGGVLSLALTGVAVLTLKPPAPVHRPVRGKPRRLEGGVSVLTSHFPRDLRAALLQFDLLRFAQSGRFDHARSSSCCFPPC